MVQNATTVESSIELVLDEGVDNSSESNEVSGYDISDKVMCDMQPDDGNTVNNIPIEASTEQITSDAPAPADIGNNVGETVETIATNRVEIQAPLAPTTTNDSALQSSTLSIVSASMAVDKLDDGRYEILGVAHWFDPEVKVPVGAWTAIITQDDGRYDLSSVLDEFVERDEVRVGVASQSEFIHELATQFPGRKTYSEKHVTAVLVKFAHREVVSFGLEPQDGFCDAEKVLGSIRLQRRTMVGHTSVWKFLEALKWTAGRTTLKVKRVFKKEAEEEKAYLSSPKYQELLSAMKLMEEEEEEEE
jgi:hypothetical protein